MFFFNGYEWDLQNPNIYIYTKKHFAHGDATSPTERVERLKGGDPKSERYFTNAKVDYFMVIRGKDTNKSRFFSPWKSGYSSTQNG
jgi:hypothetical protein